MNSKEKESVKLEVTKILEPIFGEDVKKIIVGYYDDPADMIKLTHNMLSNYMGEKNTKKLLKNIFKKFPKLRKEVS